MLSPPLNVVAGWPPANYADPVTSGRRVMIINIVTCAISALVVSLRVYTRSRITHTTGADDFFSIAGLLVAIAMSIITSISIEKFGWNRHIWDIPQSMATNALRLNLVSMVLFGLSSTCIRISLLWFMLRLIGPGWTKDTQIIRFCLIVTITFVSFLALLFVFLLLFQCSPVKAWWDIDPQYPYHCLDNNQILLAANIQNVFTDFLAVVAPIPVIYRLKLRQQQRFIVIGLFGLGLSAVAIGIYRTIYMHKLLFDYDISWHTDTAFITSIVELGLGLVCSCAPALRPFLAYIFPGWIHSSAVPQVRPEEPFYFDQSSLQSRSRDQYDLYALELRPCSSTANCRRQKIVYGHPLFGLSTYESSQSLCDSYHPDVTFVRMNSTQDVE